MPTWFPPESLRPAALRSGAIRSRKACKGDLMKRFVSVAVLAISFLVAAQAQVKKDTVAGITNLARLETTVACAGAVTPSAVAEIKKMGFASIINLRQPTEPGADIEAEAAAAKA